MPFLIYIWKKSDHIICISHEVENWLLGYSKNIKYTVINYWIDLPSFKEFDKNISKVTIGFMGRLNENKGIEDLLEAFLEIENTDLELLIGGVGKKFLLLLALLPDLSCRPLARTICFRRKAAGYF